MRKTTATANSTKSVSWHNCLIDTQTVFFLTNAGQEIMCSRLESVWHVKLHKTEILGLRIISLCFKNATYTEHKIFRQVKNETFCLVCLSDGHRLLRLRANYQSASFPGSSPLPRSLPVSTRCVLHMCTGLRAKRRYTGEAMPPPNDRRFSSDPTPFHQARGGRVVVWL